MKWAICDKFHDYLYGHHFKVLTDNNPLTYVLTTAKLDATGDRWLSSISAYDFEISYRPGIRNGDADALSRLPDTDAEETISTESVKAICGLVQSQPFVESLSCHTDIHHVMRNSLLDEDHEQFMTKEDWRRIQDEDRMLKYWINNIKEETCPDTNHLPEQDRHEHLNIRKSFHKLTLEEDILYRKIIINISL